MKILAALLYIFLIVLGVSFAVLNANTVTINLFAIHLSMPISLVIVSSIALGCAIGVLLMMAKLISTKRDLKQAYAHLKIIEKEINNLRVMPVKDQH